MRELPELGIYNHKVEEMAKVFCRGPNAKALWKILYRRLRVFRRESRKAGADLMLHGTGCVMVPDDGDPHRIHPQDMAPEALDALEHDNQHVV